MESPTYVLLSQQSALDRQMQIVANNMANVNTTGYKQRNISFEEYMMRPDKKFTHHMVVDGATFRNTAQGTLMRTDNPLDLAISGKGYFAVETPEGTQYTRQGAFQMNAEGQLVTMDGYRVLSGGGTPVTIPTEARQIAIGKDGTISTDVGNVGKLEVVSFANEEAMEETHGGLYKTGEQPLVDGSSSLNQGFVEGSNVKPVVEITRILEISRAYQRVSNMMNSENDRMRNVIRTLGRVS